MADNVELPSGSGGAVVATDDDGTAHHQYVKLEFGADNTQTKVSSANPLPVIAGSNSGVDIGDVTVNNGSGASAVPIQDGGNSITVDNGGTFVVQENGTQVQADDAAFTPATSKVVMVGATFDDTLPDSVDEGDGGAVRMSANRNLYVRIRDNAGNERGLNIDANGEIQISGTRNALPITDNGGNLSIDDGGNSITVDNGGTFAVQESGTHVQADDAAFTPATSKVMMAGFTFDDVAPDSVNEGDGGAARMSANRNQYVQIRDNAGNERGLNIDANGEIQISGSRNALPITDNGGSVTVDNGGTFAVQATVAAGATNIAKAEDVASADADVGVPAMAVRKATPANTSGSDGDYEFLQMSAGRLWVDPSGVTLTVASHAVTNAGTFVTQENGAALTSLQLLDDVVVADDAAFTPATTKVLMVGFEADESATDSVDEGDGGAARMTLDRKQIVTLQPHTAGGLSTFMASGSDGSSILVATAQVIKASAGQLYGYYAYNPEAAVTFVHFYNTAAGSVTVGTTNPLFTIAIPAGSAANLSIPQGITFSNAGWSCAATTTAGGNTAPSTGVSLVAWYA